MRIVALLILFANLAAGVTSAPGGDELSTRDTEAVEEPAPSLDAPAVYERVWYRAGRKKGLGKLFNSSGDLSIGRDALTFTKRKRTLTIPMDRIQVISFGKMKGDVDTNWVVLGLGESAPEKLVGFKDGRRLGYGARTREIYEALRAELREAGAAQYRVPRGFRTFDDFEDQLTFAVPQGWDSHLQSVVLVADRAPWGTILFSSETIPGAADRRRSEREGKPGVLGKVLAGEVPAFFVERTRAEPGVSCKGLSAKVRKRLLERAARELRLEADHAVVEQPVATEISIGGCGGLLVRGRSKAPDGVEAWVELNAVAHGETEFVLGLRSVAKSYEAAREPLEVAVSTVKFTVAR